MDRERLKELAGITESVVGDVKRKLTGRHSRADHAIRYSKTQFKTVENGLDLLSDADNLEPDQIKLLKNMQREVKEALKLLRELEQEG
jgi:hypothetical protein